MTGRVAGVKRTADSLDDVPPSQLEDMERRARAMLFAIWRAQNVKYKIIRVESNGYFQDMEVVNNE